ncbi:NUDIX domain-containing protein [Candidatus Bealeia paramacronuclearis]|uniref:NUDIX domain-containing protein n=2 Tax=Candidatus Bealeia paramacronuclearis TaxID=1921001 RepID=A0ABZ2C193_9PROT|nr:NUDIX domain-containing protein [Candidatus Bealeia paramacronuclearis]
MNFLHGCKNFILSLFQKTTIGVRILVKKEDYILLVHHTYAPDWHCIGGGVDPHETPHQAACRELYEEGGIRPKGPLTLFGFYYNPYAGRHDYVALYICEDFDQVPVSSPEIDEIKWFSLNNLPPDLSPATRRRVEEYFNSHSISDRW